MFVFMEKSGKLLSNTHHICVIGLESDLIESGTCRDKELTWQQKKNSTNGFIFEK